MISADLLPKQMCDLVTGFATYMIDNDAHVPSWNADALEIFAYRYKEVLGADSSRARRHRPIKEPGI